MRRIGLEWIVVTRRAKRSLDRRSQTKLRTHVSMNSGTRCCLTGISSPQSFQNPSRGWPPYTYAHRNDGSYHLSLSPSSLCASLSREKSVTWSKGTSRSSLAAFLASSISSRSPSSGRVRSSL
jgi:hypothetical protein